MRESHDTIVIGGGQAGLAISHHLTQLGREHVVLERHRVAERWRSERWDSLAFQFPNRLLHLNGHKYAGAPEAFAGRDEIIRFLEDCAQFARVPIRCGVEVRALRQEPGSEQFVLETPEATLESRNVVIATGPYQRAKIPAIAAGLPPELLQLHANAYRNPEQLPPGAVLVVGSGASGCQIAEELYRPDRSVYFSISRHRRIPRRYRGWDLLEWLDALGLLDQNLEQLKDGIAPPPIVLTGADGGHDLDLREFAAEGVNLVGYLRDVRDGKLSFADNVEPILREADAAYDSFQAEFDEYLRRTGAEAPKAEIAPASARAGSASNSKLLELDLRTAGITSVIWCTGYQDDFGWVKLPVLDAAGSPVHADGVSTCPGAYFLGLRWMRKWKSTFLFGAGEDAEYIAERIAARR